MKVSELAEKTGLSCLNDCKEDKDIAGVYISDMVSDVITGARADTILVTLQTHKSLIAAANLADVAAIVIVRGRKPSEDVVGLARKAGIGLYSTEADTWSFATEMYQLGIR